MKLKLDLLKGENTHCLLFLAVSHSLAANQKSVSLLVVEAEGCNNADSSAPIHSFLETLSERSKLSNGCRHKLSPALHQSLPCRL